MREIKFRAYDKRAKKMYQVDRLGIGKYPYQQYADGDDQPNTGYNKFYPFEVEIMQYTGLKDKNGVEIYEGDILEDGYPVVYGDWNCGCCADIFGYDLGFCSRDNLKVIGNIYENPELLKENSEC